MNGCKCSEGGRQSRRKKCFITFRWLRTFSELIFLNSAIENFKTENL